MPRPETLDFRGFEVDIRELCCALIFIIIMIVVTESA